MIMRSLAVILIVLGSSTLEFAQRENLLKNPSGDQDLSALEFDKVRRRARSFARQPL
jgi:hypothetical protein